MPQRLRRTIRGLEKLIEPLRYQFDDLEKQSRRRPMGIDLTATMEILHKSLARIEQELGSLRERVDMELLLQNDSLSEEGLPGQNDTPPVRDHETDQAPPRDSRDDLKMLRSKIRRALEDDGGASKAEARAFKAAQDPFAIPSPLSNEATRADDRANDDTLLLRPVNLPRAQVEDQRRLDLESTQINRDRSGDETLILERAKPGR